MIFIFLHFAALLLTRSLAQENAGSHKVGFMLPGNIIPTHYDLRWIITDDCPNEEEFNFNKKFSGIAQITMEAIKPDVKVIEINAKHLNFIKVTLSFENESNETTLQPVFYEREEKVLLNLPFELPVSKPLLLNITFEGVMTYGGPGMFIVTHMIPHNDRNKTTKRKVIGTLLEPAYARVVYPCFDEPEYKATFSISIDISACVVHKGYLVYSNSPLKNIERRDNRIVQHFEKTNVVMSTYLMTIAIAPFVSTPNQRFNSSYPNASMTEWKDMKTWGTSDFVHSKMGLLMQKAGIRSMEIFTNDFHMGYPFQKLDQLNILLGDLPSGMENWGAVFYTFRSSEYQNVYLLAHELAHQWFGNLVTCHWWSDIWLNEGFATYFATYGTHKFALEYSDAKGWNPLIEAVSHTLRVSLENDILQSRPLTQPVEDPRSYYGLFDVIAYKKGGSILRMWNYVLGEEAFLKAIQKYLDERKLKVVKPKQLFEALDSVTEISSSNFGKDPPSKYFEKWTTQRGYPLVTVLKSDINSSEYILTQRIFKAPKNKPPAKWTIPISYSTSSNLDFNKTHAMLWFRDEDETAVIKLSNPVDWIIVNNKFTGYYRVNYEKDNWMAIFHILTDNETYHKIPIENRIQILSDLFAITGENITFMDYNFAMNLTSYLKHETDYYPWKAALDGVLSFLDIMLSKNESSYLFFKEYVKDLLQDNYSRLSFNKRQVDSYNVKQLRLETLKWACRMDHSECTRDSNNFLNSFLPSGNIYDEPHEDRELYEIAYCTITRNGINDWKTLWEKFSSATNFEDKKTILHGISCSNDENIIKRVLMKSVDFMERLSNNERLSILMTVMNTDPRNVGIAFDFFMARYVDIHSWYSGTRTVADLLLQFAEKLGTDEELDKMNTFVSLLKEAKDVGLTAADFENALAITESNNLWLREKSDQVIHWLIKHYG